MSIYWNSQHFNIAECWKLQHFIIGMLEYWFTIAIFQYLKPGAPPPPDILNNILNYWNVESSRGAQYIKCENIGVRLPRGRLRLKIRLHVLSLENKGPVCFPRALIKNDEFTRIVDTQAKVGGFGVQQSMRDRETARGNVSSVYFAGRCSSGSSRLTPHGCTMCFSSFFRRRRR